MYYLRMFVIIVFGGILPLILFRRIYLGMDLEPTGANKLFEEIEIGPLYEEPLVFEWLMLCVPILPARIYWTRTGELYEE